MIIGAMFIRQGLADVAICGAVDFCLVEPILAGFATMNGAMKNRAGEPLEPEKACRPFALDRKGFIVSEGAGSIIIAAREFAAAHGLKPSMELAGWSMTSDANHFVAPNFETVKRCVVESIERAGISPGDIAAVNAHATSTKVGDRIESDVLKDVFGGRVPPVTANKSFMGHAMGASSAIESIYCMEGMRRGALLPTINYTPDPEIDLPVATELMKFDQEFVLKNSFGFGGCNSCIVFKRVV
jgi:3-oxoacyl-[acyl-carrier-protein] synthase II